VRHARSASVSPLISASAFGDPNRRLAPPTSRTPVRPLFATAAAYSGRRTSSCSSPGAARLDSLTRVAEQPLHRALGLSDGELGRISELLGREPNHFELAVFSLLWSEHCAYKHSALLLRRFPTTGTRVLQGPGENAGVVDLGEGEAVAFKVESHNHPSAVEPFQGAATGVGGILRDIVAMGARPVALLDGLRFGKPGWQFERAVEGIAHYGNCLAADERVVFRNSGRIGHAKIGELAEKRGLSGATWTTAPNRPFEVLSINPETHEPVWVQVSRIFKRSTERVLRIKMALGRCLTVTPDHPVMIWANGRLEQKTASRVRVGDRIPMLAALPQTQTAVSIDLIDTIHEPKALVVLPRDWQPSSDLRRELKQHIPRADRRHYWLRRRELPINTFLVLEELVSVPRAQLVLRLDGPRSTRIPAIFPLDVDTARLVGYYLAEGCCSTVGGAIKVIWTFGRNDRDAECVDEVCRTLTRLGIRHRVETRQSTYAITVSSRIFGHLFRDVLECGCRADQKRIPSVLYSSSSELRRALLGGLFRGDGCFDFPTTGSAVRIRHTTVSRELHDQLLSQLQSFGIFPSSSSRPGGPGVIAGRLVRHKPSYHLEFSGHAAVEEAAGWFSSDDASLIRKENRRTAHSPFARHRYASHGTLASIPVVSIDIIDGQSAVYDLEVPGTHLFATTGGIITHNCVGVPTVGGDTVFDVAYEDNCLVNAMCVGLLPRERLTRAAASGVGKVIALYGATTGRDGIGGASVLASQELGEEAHEKRPSVQIGDPFTGKKLIEVSVELTERGLVESLQDLGAAGLASALAEMARAGRGIDVHLDRVPLREPDLEPWEIMISESQERMVAVVAPENTAAVEEVCRRWELQFAVIGEVTDTGSLRAFFADEEQAEIPARLLTDEAPRYRVGVAPRPAAPPAPAPPVTSTRAALLELLASPNVRSRAWIYRRYDHLVGSRTVRRPGLDAAVLRLKPSYRGLAVSLDGSGRACRLDPRIGGALSVLEAARNVACAGGEPLALTDCLNFGNPEKPEIAWELEEAIEGMAEACEALSLPVVSGNVSLYNETEGRAIHPTPTVGCVGLVADVRAIPGRWREGDAIFLAGDPELTLDGSELQALRAEPAGRPAPLDLAAEAALVDFLWSNAPRLTLAHDASEGGIAVTIAEAAIWSGIGADLELPDDPRALFGEGGGQAVVACAAEVAASLTGIPLRRIGTAAGTTVLGIPVTELRTVWEAG